MGYLYIYHTPVLFTSEPDILKLILEKDFNYFVDHGLWNANQLEKSDHLSDKIWCKNMFFAEGEKWKSIRKIFSPIFTSGNKLV